MPCAQSLAKNPHHDLESLGIMKPCGKYIPQKYAENFRRLNTQMHAWKAIFWHALFKPNQALLDASDAVLQQMKPYDFILGLHVRLGGQVGGRHDAFRVGIECAHSCLPADLNHKQWFQTCALNITTRAQRIGKKVAWYLTTDQPDEVGKWFERQAQTLKVAILHHKKSRVIHSGKSANMTSLEWVQTISDWYLLTKATQIVQSPSSFSLTAAMWSGNAPILLGEEC